MDKLLGFFSDLILFTAGILVILLWAGAIIIVSVEAWDGLTGYNKKHPIDDDEEEY